MLDGKGAEALSQHGFFGDEGAKVGFRIRGRTVTASGEEFPLDPEKDVRDLDVKDSRGRTRRVIRTAYFRHVEPGAVLDLAWVETEGDLPDLEAVELQTSLPISRMEVRSDAPSFRPDLPRQGQSAHPPVGHYQTADLHLGPAVQEEDALHRGGFPRATVDVRACSLRNSAASRRG